jgi:hypothetical protein
MREDQHIFAPGSFDPLLAHIKCNSRLLSETPDGAIIASDGPGCGECRTAAARIAP